MYRGRPPPRRACQSPPRPYQPEPGYRSDRNRPRPPYPHSYNNYRQPDPYSRSPPHRYPSPGLGRHRDGHFRSGDPSRQVRHRERRPASQIANDLSVFVATVAAKYHWTSFSTQARFLIKLFTQLNWYIILLKGSLSPRKPIPLDQKLVITVGNELTGASRLVPSHHHDRFGYNHLEFFPLSL